MIDEVSPTAGLYSFRSLDAASTTQLNNWILENGIPNPVPLSELHCTIVNSSTGLPNYLPHEDPITVKPSTFRIEMLNQALVVSFQNSTLDQQFKTALSQGATMEFTRFLPHISVSYQVPTTFQLSELKPPTTPITLQAEQCRPQDNWAVSARRVQTEGRFSASAEELRVFEEFLRTDCDLEIIEAQVKAKRLVPIQEVSKESVQPLLEVPLRVLTRKYLVSSDLCLLDLDAHRRHQALIFRNPELRADVHKVDTDSETLQRLFEEYFGG